MVILKAILFVIFLVLALGAALEGRLIEAAFEAAICLFITIREDTVKQCLRIGYWPVLGLLLLGFFVFFYFNYVAN